MPKFLFDKIYKNCDDLVFGSTPSRILDSYLNNNPTTGQALDLGCGEGRDTVPLLRRGFSVTAVDISRAGIGKLIYRRDLTPEMRKALTTVVCDVLDLDWPVSKYDLVLAVTLLDHLEAEHIPDVCRKMVRATRENGIIFVEVHTDRDPAVTGEGPISDLSSQIKHYFVANELVELFSPYLSVLIYEDRIEWDYDHGEPHQHGFASLLGQKCKNRVSG